MSKFLEISAYIGLSALVGALSGWRYVMWCVDKSEKIIRDKLNGDELSAEEKEVLQNFLENSLNKIK